MLGVGILTRFVTFWVLFTGWSLGACSLGYVLFKDEGLIFALSFCLFVLTFICLFADKVFLVLLEARRPSGIQKASKVVRNFCFKHGYTKVNVYKSFRFNNSVFLIKSIFGSPTLVIGSEVEQRLSTQEFNELLLLSLNTLTKPVCTLNSLTVLLYIVMLLPYLIFDFLIDGRLANKRSFFRVLLTNVNNLIFFFFTPFFYLKDYMVSLMRQSVAPAEQSNRTLKGAISKVRTLKIVRTRYLFENIILDLGIIRQKDSNMAVMILKSNEVEA